MVTFFPFFRLGDAEALTSAGGSLPLFLLSTSVPWTLISESGVTIHSSGKDMSTSKQLGTGERNPPCGQVPVASRMNASRPEPAETAPVYLAGAGRQHQAPDHKTGSGTGARASGRLAAAQRRLAFLLYHQEETRRPKVRQR